MAYTHLTMGDLGRIETYHNVGLSAPEIADKRGRSKQPIIERLSKLIITLKPDGRMAKDIETSLDFWLDYLPLNLFKSIIFDCGKEFSNWINISNHHDVAIFFADSSCPSQRGLNEQSNGLLRRDGLFKSKWILIPLIKLSSCLLL